MEPGIVQGNLWAQQWMNKTLISTFCTKNIFRFGRHWKIPQVTTAGQNTLQINFKNFFYYLCLVFYMKNFFPRSVHFRSKSNQKVIPNHHPPSQSLRRWWSQCRNGIWYGDVLLYSVFLSVPLNNIYADKKDDFIFLSHLKKTDLPKS